MTWRPSPTITVTAIIKISNPSISPPIPSVTALPPRVLRYNTKGNTAAAVQSIDAAAYPIP